MVRKGITEPTTDLNRRPADYKTWDRPQYFNNLSDPYLSFFPNVSAPVTQVKWKWENSENLFRSHYKPGTLVRFIG